jgi:hypothetical protein
MRRIEHIVMEDWYAADHSGQPYLLHQFLYHILREGKLDRFHQIDPPTCASGMVIRVAETTVCWHF